MKFKLDENLGMQAAEILRKAGYDISTVLDEKLAGTSDRVLIETCRTERRCLITLDKEFSNPLLFEPADYYGIVVLRLPPKPSPKDLLDVLRTLATALKKRNIQGKLWVVQRGRVREYQPYESN